jgi:hypothetical protein
MDQCHAGPDGISATALKQTRSCAGREANCLNWVTIDAAFERDRVFTKEGTDDAGCRPMRFNRISTLPDAARNS